MLAGRFGSHELGEIRRQESSWGKEMASCFANGDTSRGINILSKEGGIEVADTLEASMSDLIAKWQESKFATAQRLIITVRNRDVDALNDGIREVLKANGTLKGEAITIERQEKVGESLALVKREFMAGDRVMFASNNKDLGIHNGEFGILLEVGRGSFVVMMDGKEERVISFDPADMHGLRHGYAVTTYKSQGASIRDVYVLHSGAGNSRSSYVNLTRHIEAVKLFYNLKNTRSLHHLKSQLSLVDEKTSSLNFLSLKDIEESRQELEKQTALKKMSKWFKDKAVVIGDRLHSNHEYYQYKAEPVAKAKVEEALVAVHAQMEQSLGEGAAVAMAGGGGFRSSNLQVRKSPKERFYDKVERSESNQYTKRAQYIRDYRGEFDQLKSELRFKSADIALKLLGLPNKALSSGNIYRYGKRGSLAIWINGNKAGSWYDFESGSGGDMIALAERENKQDFKGAVDWLRDLTGVSRLDTLKVISDNEVGSKYAKIRAESTKKKAKELREAKRISYLHVKSKPITCKSVTSRYLREARSIELPPEGDIRTTAIWDAGTKRNYPAIISFARDASGKITGGQTILLDPETCRKADVSIVKRSFGKIGGSFVEVQKHTDQSNNENKITFIAEGLETALSIKEAGVEGWILCSLGIGNIKSYKPEAGEKVMICADNDGLKSKTAETIAKARINLEDSGAVVYVVSPKEKGDFNDVLQTQGSSGVRSILEPEIARLKADNGVARVLEKLAVLKHQTGAEKPELQEQIAIFEKDLELACKYAPASCYRIAKAYSESGFELARKTAKEVTVNAISRNIEQNTQDNKQDNENKTDYLAGLAKDEEVMDILSSSHLAGEIHKAVIAKEIEAEDRRKEFEMTIRLHQDKLDDMARLDLKFDAEKFKEELKNLPDKTREEKIKDAWLDSFRDHIAPKLDHFDKLKQEAKSTDEYLDVVKQELKEGTILYKAHKRLIEHGAVVLNDNRIESLQFLHEDKPEFTEHLARDIKHGASHGLWTEKEALETLNTGKPLRFLTDSFEGKCRKYHLDYIGKDLRHIDQGTVVEKDDQRFNTHKAYLEHHASNEVLKPYLQNTIVTQRLSAIYKQEALQKQQEQELEKEMQLEKEYGKGGLEL